MWADGHWEAQEQMACTNPQRAPRAAGPTTARALRATAARGRAAREQASLPAGRPAGAASSNFLSLLYVL